MGVVNRDAQRFALHFYTAKEEFTPAEKRVILNPEGATLRYWRSKFDLHPEDIPICRVIRKHGRSNGVRPKPESPFRKTLT